MFQLKFFWRERYDTIFNYKNLNKLSEISWKQMNYLNFEMGMKLFVPTHGESPGDDHHSENDQKMEWNSKWNWKESTDIYRFMYWYIYIYIYTVVTVSSIGGFPQQHSGRNWWNCLVTAAEFDCTAECYVESIQLAPKKWKTEYEEGEWHVDGTNGHHQ